MDKKFLIEYLNTDSPCSNEVEAQKAWIEQVKGDCEQLITDNYGNTVALIRKTDGDINEEYKVVIDAHCDEIGWVISRITDDGFIYVKRNGGTDNDITPGTRVKIMTEKWGEDGKQIKVKGFFGWIPIHLKKKTPDKPTEDNLFIDVSASSLEDIESMGIEVGNYIVVDREAEIINDKYVVGKSLDDKVGGFILSEVLKKLKEDNVKLPYDLYVVNSVQEEVGLRGAKMITETIKPDVAICFDVCFDTNTPMIDKLKYGDFKMGDGVVFRQGSDVHINLLRLMKKVATEKEVPYKVSVGGGGGTNTFSYYLSNGGVVTSTLSIPLRYMHTPNEMVMLDDIQKTVDYYVELLKNIEYKHDFKLV
jgi:tetrahedral aminopeptidase